MVLALAVRFIEPQHRLLQPESDCDVRAKLVWLKEGKLARRTGRLFWACMRAYTLTLALVTLRDYKKTELETLVRDLAKGVLHLGRSCL